MKISMKLSQIGNFEPFIWEKKIYFLQLGTTPKTRVGFIAKKITASKLDLDNADFDVMFLERLSDWLNPAFQK